MAVVHIHNGGLLMTFWFGSFGFWNCCESINTLLLLCRSLVCVCIHIYIYMCTYLCAWSLCHVQFFCDPMNCSLPASSAQGILPGKNAGVGSQSFLQGIFPTQSWNPNLLHCRQILYHLSHQELMYIYMCTIYERQSGIESHVEMKLFLSSMYRCLHQKASS